MLRKNQFIKPCQPRLRKEPPIGYNWCHEVKFDGYRVQIHKDGSNVALYSKNGHDFTSRFPGLVSHIAKRMTTKAFILDAELTAINDEGHPDFGALLMRLPSDVCVWVFDILSLRGKDLRSLPLYQRQNKLDVVKRSSGTPLVQWSETFTDPIRLLDACSKFELEGIVSKRTDSTYSSGPSKNWIKVKCAKWREDNRWRHEFFAKRKYA